MHRRMRRGLYETVFFAPEMPGAAALGGDGGQGGGGGASPAFDFTKLDQPIQKLLTDRGFYANNALDTTKLITSYYNSDRALSGAKDVVPIPGDGATPEQWNAFYDRMGRPKDASGYDSVLKWPQDTTPELQNFARSFFHSMGIPPSQAPRALELWNNFAKQSNEQFAAKLTEMGNQAVAALKTEYGDQFDGFVKEGKAGVAKLGLKPEELKRIEAVAGTGPMLKLFAALGKAMGGGAASGDPLAGGGGQGGAGGGNPAQMTPQQANAEIKRLEGDADFQKKYWSATEPGHAEAVERMNALYMAASKVAAA